MPGSARPCWTGSPIAPTFSRPARNPIDSGGRPKNAIGRRKRRKATKVSCGNAATAAGFPHSHSYGGGLYSYGKAKKALPNLQRPKVGQIKPPEMGQKKLPNAAGPQLHRPRRPFRAGQFENSHL